MFDKTRELLRRGQALVKGLPRHALWLMAFGGMFVAVLWALALGELERDRELYETALEDNLGSFARALDGHLGAAVRAIDASLLLLRSEYLHHDHDIDWQAALLSRSFMDDGITQIAVIGADGVLRYSNLANPAPRTYLGDREHFKVHEASSEDRLFISKPILGRVSGKWTLQFTRKVLADDGSFAGVIVLSLDPTYFGRFYDSVQLGRGGVVTLAGTDGIVRARSASPDRAVGRDVADAPPFRPGAGPQGHFRWRSQIDHVDRLYSYRRLANLPLVVIVGMAEDEAFAHLKEQRRDYLLSALVGTLVVAALIAMLVVQTRRQYAAETRYRHLMHHASDGMILCDGAGLIRDANRAACRSLGYAVEELVGRPYSLVDRSVDAERLAALAGTTAPPRVESVHVRKEGRSYPVETTLSLIPDTDRLILGIFRDISERKAIEEQMWRKAHLDPLTGIPNRILFRDRLNQAIAQAKRRSDTLALLFVDLDLFKGVNDTLGHDAGDELLKGVANRLQAAVREQDTVARLGGDEFCLMLPSLARPDEAAVVAQKILDTLKRPFVLGDHSVCISASIGVTTYPADGDSAESLLKSADRAMYWAKAQGRGQYARGLS